MAHFQQTELECCEDRIYAYWVKPTFKFILRQSSNVEIDAKLITKFKEAKSLGVIIDEHLSWSNHIGDLSKISSAIGALKRIRPYISKRSALQIYQALILPHFDYCSSVWGDCNLTLSDKLQRLQNRAARAITTEVQLRHKCHFPFKSVKIRMI